MEENSFKLKANTLMDIFSCNKENIARGILSLKIRIDVEKTPFTKIRSQYIQDLNLDELAVPKNEMDFYEFICNKELKINTTPSEELLKQLIECVDDLNFLNNIKEKHQNILESVEKDKNIEGKQYKIKLQRHYLKKIQNDENEIKDFLRKDLFIEAFYNSTTTPRFSIKRYPFKMAKLFYINENMSEIIHKISFVPITEITEFCTLFNHNRKEFYHKIREKYPPKILMDDIKKAVCTNHILQHKESILHKLLNFYLNDEWELFLNICPQQIEGMLYNLALEIGIKEESLKTSSITDKANFIFEKSKLFSEYDHEYFSFIFPIVRNRISHGQNLGVNLEDIAYSLLFDLKTIVLFYKSSILNYNKAVSIMNKIEKDESNIYYLLEYIDLFGTKIDKFYKPKYTDIEIKKMIKKEFTFEKIKSKYIKGTVGAFTILYQAEKLVRLNINKDDCKKVINYYTNGKV